MSGMPEKKRDLINLAKRLGVETRRLKRFGLDRDVLPLARKVLIGQLKRSTKTVSIESGMQ